MVHDRQPVAEVVGLLHVVGRQEDRLALLPEPLDEVPQRPPGGRVETGRRLVEEDDLGVVDQGEGDRQALALAARQLPGLSACRRSPRSRKSMSWSVGSGPRVEAPEQVEDLDHGQLRVELGGLEGDPDPLLERVRLADGVDPEDLELAARPACAGPRASRPSSSCRRRSARAARRPRRGGPRSETPSTAWTSPYVLRTSRTLDDDVGRGRGRHVASRRRESGRLPDILPSGLAPASGLAVEPIRLRAPGRRLGSRAATAPAAPAPGRRSPGTTRAPSRARRRARPAPRAATCARGRRSRPGRGRGRARPPRRSRATVGSKTSSRQRAAPSARSTGRFSNHSSQARYSRRSFIRIRAWPSRARIPVSRSSSRMWNRRVVTATRRRRRAGPVARLELDLVDREAEVVEPADPGLDGEPVVGAEL